jgi:3'(2'), 5'-bisphosphate nucleotidase
VNHPELGQEQTGNSYDMELRTALGLAREAGATILDHYSKPIKVERKIDSDDYLEPVTETDRAANDLIVAGIRSAFPDDGILAEESVDTEIRLSKRRVWMVDPLDGTNGFIARDGDFAVQIGLSVDGASVMGVVYQPLPDILFWGAKGGGAWVTRRNSDALRLRVSQKSELTDMRLAASRSHRSPRMDRVVKALGVRDEVNRGSVGVKVGLIVDRQCDVYVHLSPRTKQWDTCAPEAILNEAGGRITDLFGYPLNYNASEVQNRNGIVATNEVVHDQIISRLKPLLIEFGRIRVGI